MNSKFRRFIIPTVLVLLGSVLVVVIASAPKARMALIAVVDAAGKPIVGAIVQPEGLRTKPGGPYQSAWIFWGTNYPEAPNLPISTDKDGFARVPYPKYVYERLETGTLCLGVSHPDFVTDRPERLVATAPPHGAPLQLWANYLGTLIRRKAVLSQPPAIVMQKGGILRVSVAADHAIPRNGTLFAQVSGLIVRDTNVWTHPKPGVIVTRGLSAGPHTVRAVQIDSDGTAWFSDVVPITAVIGQTNELVANLKRGATVRGKLDDTVPRPVKNGRVVVNIWPHGLPPRSDPPMWHTWSEVLEDGSFSIGALPEGDLEIVVLCQGFVSTNGPGSSTFRHPQKHLLGTSDLTVVIGMESTARLEVKVTDEKGRALNGVRVVTWPNVHYGDWSATILMNDCYSTSERLISGPTWNPWQGTMWRPVLDFEGVSDSAGMAVLPNLPPEVTTLSAEHPQFELPAVGTAGAGKTREAGFTLIAGQTNHLFIQLEPRDRSKITHY